MLFMTRFSSTLSSLVDGDEEDLADISPISAKCNISDSSKPFAGPRLQPSAPYLANASLNLLIC